jgi:hypothetical protein
MTSRDALTLIVIRTSIGLGCSYLASIFLSEGYARGGFFVPFAVGIFVMLGLTASFFGDMKAWVYFATTLGLAALILLLGIPS